MAYTPHGHHIPGTAEYPHTTPVQLCGGPDICKICAVHCGSFSEHPSNTNKQERPDANP